MTAGEVAQIDLATLLVSDGCYAALHFVYLPCFCVRDKNVVFGGGCFCDKMRRLHFCTSDDEAFIIHAC